MSKYTLTTRYLRLPFYKRWVLWWRYKPIAYIIAILRICYWVICGMPMGGIKPDNKSRKETLDLIWFFTISQAHYKMGHYEDFVGKELDL